jgi:hypothetical protein
VRVVCVHGIGQHLEGERTLLAAWLPALRDGLTRAAAAMRWRARRGDGLLRGPVPPAWFTPGCR